ncbi:basic amino acid ABC transporter substrate-binding protein [Desulfofundulus thermosubterraneus]|uniref:Amino acid ABC transporter substrate-binding protein, PAAT family n=1 Tax=Desulfofundulus thermosubterraneus DSM 16057 TaxID=1121432 RepID=A0A1M6BIG5_9FIRM|nr:basic amino acid ABC transporter substrate-binding protein [Desulfofundulus thermosubterraneus]SHI48505.1 amino acid ABC transporter substrate-binding protein, PAAT family [Desulfofundulus thermosubterraneus DSM 16057]
MLRTVKVIVVMLVVLALAVAGCGGQQAKDTKDSKQTSAQTGGGQQPTGKQKILVASDTAYAPFEFQDPNTGKYVGFDMELIQAIAEVNNWDYEIRSMNFDGIVPALQSASVDLAISAMTITDKRKEQVNFSLPYYQSGQCVAVKASNNTIKGFDDLAGKKIGVQIATTGADEARKIPGAKITDYNTINEAFMALKNGNVDAVVNDYPVTFYFIQQGNKDVKIVGDLRTSEFYGIAVPKSKPDILEKVNSALKTLKENGKYAEIYKKWFGKEPPEFLPGEPPAK